tara:strand:- start:51 stop:182 length:132 start_codon:yes stop_codon:yes gene_type:complete
VLKGRCANEFKKEVRPLLFFDSSTVCGFKASFTGYNPTKKKAV